MSLTVSSKSKSKSESTTRAPKRRAAQKNSVSEDEIRILAYKLYERRQGDGADGDPAADWIEAERRLKES